MTKDRFTTKTPRLGSLPGLLLIVWLYHSFFATLFPHDRISFPCLRLDWLCTSRNRDPFSKTVFVFGMFFIISLNCIFFLSFSGTRGLIFLVFFFLSRNRSILSWRGVFIPRCLWCCEGKKITAQLYRKCDSTVPNVFKNKPVQSVPGTLNQP